jgi:tRNA pseudouridine55 synthase
VTVDGLLLVDKPEGPTSHDMVARARRLLGQRRIGHTGTLDPMATGLLPLVLGRATRLARFLPHSPKRYEGEFVLGVETSTDDRTGETVSRHDGSLPDVGSVLEAARSLEGKVRQVPPDVSAKKVDGVRLYRRVRRGQAVAPRPVDVEVERFALVPGRDASRWKFEAEVSSGTYIRALVRDLGRDLGCGATLWELRRTAIGPLGLSAATLLPDGDDRAPAGLDDRIIPMDLIPLELPAVTLGDGDSVRRFLAGTSVSRPGLPDEGPVRVLNSNGRLLGVADVAPPDLQPRVVVAPMAPDGDLAG